MSNGMFRAALVIAAMSVFAASVVFGAEANAPAEPKPTPAPAPEMVKGMVSVVKDANGVVTAVKLIVAEEKMAHNVVLDKEGMELVKEDGKMVEARVMKKGADLKVLSFKVIEKAAETPAEKPAEKPKM